MSARWKVAAVNGGRISRMVSNFMRAAFHLLPALAIAALASSGADAQALALVGARVYPSPTAAPLDDATIVTSGGVIAAIGKRGDVQIPEGSRIIDCTGKTVVAGFWNSHVHFTEPAWNNAANAPAGALETHMREMLTRWGFTTVWDLGSNPFDSLPLRRRITAGEVAGPSIFLAGGIFPEHGHPVYLPPDMRLPEAATPDQAAQMARNALQIGLDGVKLFTGSFMGVDKPVVNMAPAIAKAAVDIAHAQGKPVFAHPQNRAGVDAVIAAGVDVMAHTIPSEPGYTPEELAQFKSQGTALIPTLSLFTTIAAPAFIIEQLVQSGVSQLKTFSQNGGRVLFGTDVGYINIYDTSLEFELMHRALSEREVLASLTTNPASYFKAARKGRVEMGFDADLVVLDRDPIADVRNLAGVAYTIRAGGVIYQKP
jgi:imidazolonepropionase-like amidohydrolase